MSYIKIIYYFKLGFDRLGKVRLCTKSFCSNRLFKVKYKDGDKTFSRITSILKKSGLTTKKICYY